ncbi:Acetyl-CoA synthetase [Kitasatospora sp. MMS16-BH015]|uniref:AMP-binding protein n=1 Tax=Kitasatospora sp. MMS16-BH015 TaxID=2018025 RepID=UPI000CA0E375|nr:AMP-binding protein [Kitasatospora sp. MMS16-BH015]AUG80606.1 Acetyl-CoA synthetase [Kitasatospora sp. MMS16-BH015]
MTGHHPEATAEFRAARDLLLELREDHDAAVARFRWPRLERFNWALDWFDVIAEGNPRTAVRILDGTSAEQLSYAELAARSNQVANWLRAQGVTRGDRVLLMLDNQLAVWETLLASIKLGLVVIPTYTTISADDLADRMLRGQVTHVITAAHLTGAFATAPAHLTRISVGAPVPGWLDYAGSHTAPAEFTPEQETRADELLFIYFTSGTTSRPKMVGHTHTSYPVGHLTGMYWNGLRPGDVHCNVSAPGWAKHAWSSFFGPFNAEATVLSVNLPAGASPKLLLEIVDRERATSLCAPPTAWRTLLQHDLGTKPAALREASSVGEPLNPAVIEQIRTAWGVTVRDGFGQTETTAQIGNTAGLAVRPGKMGKPLPGYPIVLIDPRTGRPGDEGEICVDLAQQPVGIMTAYLGDPEKTAKTLADGLYHTGDIATRDADGYLTYVGRDDDVFKSYDHRISPFELESVLLRHEAVAEAAVIPVPDPIGYQVPKAYIALAAGHEPDAETAREVLGYAARTLAPHQQLALLEFAELPKTTSGKIRRAELRATTAGFEYRTEELLGRTMAHGAPGL